MGRGRIFKPNEYEKMNTKASRSGCSPRKVVIVSGSMWQRAVAKCEAVREKVAMGMVMNAASDMAGVGEL